MAHDNTARSRSRQAAAMHTQGRPEWVTTADGRGIFTQVLAGPDEASGAAATAYRPTVVFEGGDAATRSSWAAVQTEVSTFARAIVYDRAGLGRSPADPVSRTMDRMADDLVAVLDHFAPSEGGRPSFILVGWSLGGPLVRLAASRRPNLIAGLVLVEPSDEAAEVLFAPSFRRKFRLMLRLGKVLAHLRLFGRLFRWLVDAAPADDVRADLRNEAFRPSVITTQLRQGQTFLDELKQWKTAAPELGTIPVTVISGCRADPRDGMPEEVRAAAIAAHAERVAAHDGRHVMAHESGHYVPVTEPGLIADEVKRMALPPTS